MSKSVEAKVSKSYLCFSSKMKRVLDYREKLINSSDEKDKINYRLKMLDLSPALMLNGNFSFFEPHYRELYNFMEEIIEENKYI
jgi:hypothetical protein